MLWSRFRVDSFDDESFRRAGGSFVAVIAARSDEVSIAEVSAGVAQLVAAGARAICFWGPGCEALHDIADEVIVVDRAAITSAAEPSVLTTWHADDSLPSVLTFAAGLARIERVDALRLYDVIGAVALGRGPELSATISDLAVAGALDMFATLPGEILSTVRYIGFSYEDPAGVVDRFAAGYLGPDDHTSEQAIELSFASGRTIHFTWDNQISGRGFGDYEIEIGDGPMVHAVASIDPVPWEGRAWERHRPGVDRSEFWRWDLRAHPTWRGAVGQAIRRVRVRMNEYGIGDILLASNGVTVVLSGGGDVVCVSPADRPKPSLQEGGPLETREWTL